MLAVLLIVPVVVFAQTDQTGARSGVTDQVGGRGTTFTFTNPLGSVNDLNSFLKLLLNFVTTLAIPLIVLALIYTGFLFISAQGNPEKLSTARRIFLWTIVGAAIILGANVLLSAISGTVNEIRRTTGYIERGVEERT